MSKGILDFINKLLIFASLFSPTKAYTQAEYTDIEGSVLYSEYFPNSESEFRGTIVFQNGSGTSLIEWTENKTFFNCARQHGRILIYNRSGLGKSPPDLSISTQKPITAQLVNSKLMKLLTRNRIKAPYILVSHSYGGLYAGHFARKRPDLIAGMLMVDPDPSNYQYSNEILEKFEYTRKKTKNIASE